MLISFFRSFAVVFVVGFLVWTCPFSAVKPVLAGAPPLWNEVSNGIITSDISAFNNFAAFQDQLNGVPAFGTTSSTFAYPVPSSSSGDQVLNMVAEDATEAFIAWGTDYQGTGDYEIHISKVDSLGNEIWDVSIGGASFFYGRAGVIKMIPDGSGGVFVLAAKGSIGPFGETSGGPFLSHINSAGVETYTSGPFGFNFADMVPSGLGSVIVVSNVGYNQDDFVQSYEQGIVRRYTTSGLDATWSGGAGQVDMTTSPQEIESFYLISDGDSGALAVWTSGSVSGLYGQRILSDGSIDSNWNTDGLELVEDIDLTPSFTVMDADFYTYSCGYSTCFNYYVTYRDGGTGNVYVHSFDEYGQDLWACVPVVTQIASVNNSDEVGLVRSGDGVFVFWQGPSAGDQGVFGQFYDVGGNTMWTPGGVLIDNAAAHTASDFDVVLKDYFSQSYFANYSRASGIRGHDFFNAQILKSYYDGLSYTTEHQVLTPTTYGGGPGNDCGAGAVPDAIADLAALAGNTEVDLTWSAPADNGDPIFDYTIEFGETVGFPGNAVPFVDGVSAVAGTTVTGLTNGTGYSFRVFAENGIGLSAVSNIATATPLGIEGRRRGEVETVQGPRIYLGRLQELFEAAQNFFSGGIHGSSDDDVIYQSSDGGETGRRFSEDEYLRTQVQPEKENLLRLLDLIIQLRHLFGWMSPDDYELSKNYVGLSKSYDQLFLTRFFHQMTGVEYLKRGAGVYEFDYRDPIHQPTAIVADFQKSILLSYGKACYGSQVLEYAEEIDYVGNSDWFKRYVFIMKPWMDVVLGKNDYVQWTSTRNIDVLESLYLFLFGYCLTDELRS